MGNVVALSEKDRSAAHALIQEAYMAGDLRAARDAAQTLVGPRGYLEVLVAALRAIPPAERNKCHGRQ